MENPQDNKIMNLHQIQGEFSASINDYSHLNLDLFKSRNPEERFFIYIRNVKATLIKTLANTYPACWKLLGEDYANALANMFLENPNNIPNSPILEEFGESFSDFLATLNGFDEGKYVADLARFEWLKNMIELAPKNECDSFKIFDSVKKNKQIGNLEHSIFIINKTILFFASDFAIDKLEESVMNDSSSKVDINSSSRAILFNSNGQIKILWINEALYKFLLKLHQKNTAEKAYSAALVLDENFNLENAFLFILQNNLLEQIYIKD